jgi:hypothetical protein
MFGNRDCFSWSYPPNNPNFKAPSSTLYHPQLCLAVFMEV